MLIANKTACDNDIVELFHGEQVHDVSSRSLSSISGCCSSNSLFQTAKQNTGETRTLDLDTTSFNISDVSQLHNNTGVICEILFILLLHHLFFSFYFLFFLFLVPFYFIFLKCMFFRKTNLVNFFPICELFPNS